MGKVIDPAAVKRILAVRTDAIGDLLLATPALTALREKFPKARIAVLVRPYNRFVLKNNPAVDELIVDDLYDRFHFGHKVSLRQYFDWAARLRAGHFDVMINLAGDFAYALTGWLAGIPYRIGDRGRVAYSWLYNYKVNQRLNSWALHEVEHNLELLAPLGIGLRPAGKCRLYPDPAELDAAAELLRERGLAGKKIIGINVGTSGTNKAWALGNFVQLIKKLSEKYRTKAVLVGGPKENELNKQILPQLGEAAVNLGGLPVELFIALLKQLDLYIANDTGPTHLAAALEVPEVILYTSKYQQPARWAPWGNRHKLIKNVSGCPYPCRPPSCRRDLCTAEITVAEVLQAAEEILAGGGKMTPEEERLDRERISFNILAAGGGERKEAAVKLLRENNWRVWELTAAELRQRSVNELLELFIRYEINIVHSFLPGNFKLRLATLLTSLKMVFPTMLVRDEGGNFSDLKSLVGYYEDKFNTRVL
ncbi:MAG: glycosyltransferase family 9 protein [Candidatus Saganbacteria bacterium]|nr:glycosyltransferase family 9 protein [Candidatus Saganbacteria bacterium]